LEARPFAKLGFVYQRPALAHSRSLAYPSQRLVNDNKGAGAMMPPTEFILVVILLLVALLVLTYEMRYSQQRWGETSEETSQKQSTRQQPSSIHHQE